MTPHRQLFKRPFLIPLLCPVEPRHSQNSMNPPVERQTVPSTSTTKITAVNKVETRWDFATMVLTKITTGANYACFLQCNLGVKYYDFVRGHDVHLRGIQRARHWMNDMSIIALDNDDEAIFAAHMKDVGDST